jgi:hypothetical protein
MALLLERLFPRRSMGMASIRGSLPMHDQTPDKQIAFTARRNRPDGFRTVSLMIGMKGRRA